MACRHHCQVASVMSDSVRPHGLQPTRLPCPWDSPGKNTGLGCHFLLQCYFFFRMWFAKYCLSVFILSTGYFAEQKFILMSFNLLVFPFMDHNISVNLRTLCLAPKDFPSLKKKRFIVLYFKFKYMSHF